MLARRWLVSLVLTLTCWSLVACAQPDLAPPPIPTETLPADSQPTGIGPETVPSETTIGEPPIEPSPVEVTPTQTGEIHPDGTVESGSGYVMPTQIEAVKIQNPKRVKASDFAKPFTAEYAVREYEQNIQKEMFQNRQGIFSKLKDNSLALMFGPKFQWYCLRYPVWPIAMQINAPLATNNIFVLDDTNKIVSLITDSDRLKLFFARYLHSVENEQEVKTALIAWLNVEQELAQDGMFQFSINDSSLNISKKGSQIIASGQSVVAPSGGNQGSLDSRLVFDGGKLVSAENQRNLQEGMRPICQSTKLLDPDPIVRRMAEQDILLMGRSCKFYLAEQRAKATPELQAAIDAIWKRIQAGKR
jgi:hypothetical protein